MARLKLCRDGIDNSRYFLEPASGLSFGRISAGLCWPFSDKPGSICVLGELRFLPCVYGAVRKDVHKLMEFASQDCGQLLERLVRYSVDYLIHSWAVPTADQRCYLLEEVNDELRNSRRPLIRYGDPRGFYGQGEGLLPFYHSLVQRRTLNEKSLFLGEGAAADEIAAFAFADAKVNIREYPAGAALCFALAELDLENGRKSTFPVDVFGPADNLGGY